MSTFKVHNREVKEKTKTVKDEDGKEKEVLDEKVLVETFENTKLGKVTEDKEFTLPAIEKALKREQGRLDDAQSGLDSEMEKPERPEEKEDLEDDVEYRSPAKVKTLEGAVSKYTETVAIWQERLDALNA